MATGLCGLRKAIEKQCAALGGKSAGGAVALTLVTPGLQILRLKEQAVLLYCRESLGGCYFALNGERLVRQAKRLKLAGGYIHAREPLAAYIKDRQAAG